MKKSGFTLAEILVVIGVLSVVGIIVLIIFSRTLRGNNKSQILTAIKENGQSVLENMDKTIRGADNVVCPVATTLSSNTLVIFKDGVYTRYRLVPQSGNCGGGSNGMIQQDIVTPSAQEADPVLFRNRICAIADPQVGAITLTDTNINTGVSLTAGSFTLNKSSGFKDIVTINFVLNPGVCAPPAVSGQIDPVTFQTTIQLR